VKRANFIGECDRRATHMIGWSIFFRGYDFWQHKMTGVISMTRKTGALRVSLLIESARNIRCGRLCCGDHHCNHRVVTARVPPLTTPPAGKTADGASQSNEGSARFDAPPRCIYPIDHDRTATLRSQSRDRT
jgi:hypothetical protein